MSIGMSVAIGWDVGGAHLKAARVTGDHVAQAVQVPCPLWQGIAHLEAAIREAQKTVGESARHAITMTGELADVFTTRAEGVAEITACMRRMLAGGIAVYAGRASFVPAEAAPAYVEDIAAANWHATANLCARKWRDGILIDIGSTTADIIPFRDGCLFAAGYDDTSRLVSRELVYTAVVRTPVMAVARDALFGGVRVPLMAEYFATMADVYRLTGELPAAIDQDATADGRGRTKDESAARLARMIGRNLGDAPLTQWRDMAFDLRQSQLDMLTEAAQKTANRSAMPVNAPVVVAGAGSFLGRAVANAIGRAHVPFEDAIDAPANLWSIASQCAPAVAVALLIASGQARDFAAA